MAKGENGGGLEDWKQQWKRRGMEALMHRGMEKSNDKGEMANGEKIILLFQ